MTVLIQPGNSIQSVIDANPLETDFLITGLHREQYIEPRSGITLRGDGTAELRGSRVVTGWVADVPGLWYAPSPRGGAQVTKNPSIGGYSVVIPGWERSADAVECFYQGTRFKHVGTLAAAKNADAWWYDYNNNLIWVGRDPALATIELSTLERAIDCLTRSNIVVDGLKITQYCAPIQDAAVRCRNAVNVTIQGCTFENIFGGAIKYGQGAKILGNTIVGMGQIGITGTGNDVIIKDNEITGCNANHTNPDFEAGGLKISRSNRVTIEHNLVRENLGKGLWGDIDNGFNGGCRITENHCLDNESSGIFWEISFDCEIDNNYCRGNGTGESTWMDECQIQIANSRNVNVHDNICVVTGSAANGIGLKQRSRGTSDTGVEWLNVNITVQDNIIVYLTTTYTQMFSGQFADYRIDLLNPTNLKWLGNIYYYPTSRPDWFQHRTNAQSYKFANWQALGYDTAGQRVVEDNPAVAAIPQWQPVQPPVTGLFDQYVEKLLSWGDVLVFYDTQSLTDPGRDLGPNNYDALLYDADDQIWLDQWAGADSFALGALAAQCAGNHAYKLPTAAQAAFNRNEFSIITAFTLTGGNDYWGQAAQDNLLAIGGTSTSGFFYAYARRNSGQLQVQFRINGTGNQYSYTIPSPAAEWPPNEFQNFILVFRHSRSLNKLQFDLWNGLAWVNFHNGTSPGNGSGTTISGSRFTLGGYDLGAAGDDKYLVYGTVYNKYLDDSYLTEITDFPLPPDPVPAAAPLFNIVPIIWKIRRRV